jgi:hypothetical protein
VATVDVVIGADIGQKQDPTAICVAELQWRGEGQREGLNDHWVIRHLGRLPLGTPYPDIVAELVRLVGAVKARVERVHVPLGPGVFEIKEYKPHVTLYVDGTGVGQPVVDLLEAAGVSPIGCYFTYGERRVQQDREVRLGKAWMVSRLQALAQTHRLHLPKTAEAEATRQELLDYEIKVSEDGHDTYGAFKTGRHDDLVTALGLAVQKPRQRWFAV